MNPLTKDGPGLICLGWGIKCQETKWGRKKIVARNKNLYEKKYISFRYGTPEGFLISLSLLFLFIYLFSDPLIQHKCCWFVQPNLSSYAYDLYDKYFESRDVLEMKIIAIPINILRFRGSLESIFLSPFSRCLDEDGGQW